MKIEVYGALFKNKGAELMLRSICYKIKEKDSKSDCVISESAKNIFSTFNTRFVSKTFPALSPITKLIPKSILHLINITDTNEITHIFDASGFAYGDQWGLKSSTYFLGLIQKWKKKGIRIIMLPQAFGPFTKPGLKEAFIEIHNNVEHVFIRDKVSYNYVKEIIGNSDKITLAPDFTNLLSGENPSSFKHKNGVAIIPNYRMIDKTTIGNEYIELLISSIIHLQHINETPFFLIHEGNDDYLLANSINNKLENPIPIYYGYNAVEIKGIIKNSKMVLGSRFHGLVSALSQGTPCIGTGWSHKYECLFNDYNFKKGILKKDDWQKIDMIIDKMLEKDNYNKNKEIITYQSNLLKKETEKMWNKVFDIIKK